MPHPIALTIAGSDPSGGAGIQSDLRVFQALGVAGLSVITALTAQNSTGVQSVSPVSAEMVGAQLDAIFADTMPHAVKIGMLGGKAQVLAVASALRKYRPENVVLDPILASTHGVSLLDAGGVAALLHELLPLCTLVTPNLNETEKLTGFPAHSKEEIQKAGDRFLTQGVSAVLVKGGHRDGDPVDTLLTINSVREFYGARVDTPHTHGTGCFLSSAITAYLALEASLPDAIEQAKALLAQALHRPIVIGQGRGYPGIQPIHDHRAHSERVRLLKGLYVLTDPFLRPDRSPRQIAAAAFAGGAKIVQLRDKRLGTPDLIALAGELNQMARNADALFIVNDRVDVALACNADGVHLGPDDMSPADARRLLGRDKLLGVSVNSIEEAQAAAPYVSYLGVGAIFGSSTKDDAGAAIGPSRITEIKKAFPTLPIVAIGGIDETNIGKVIAAGADSGAVISAVVMAEDMAETVKKLNIEFVR